MFTNSYKSTREKIFTNRPWPCFFFQTFYCIKSYLEFDFIYSVYRFVAKILKKIPVDTRRKLNVHKTFKLCPVSTGIIDGEFCNKN